MASNLFETDPDWTSFAKKHGYLKDAGAHPSIPVKLDIPTNRAQQNISEAEWTKNHPLESVGYTSFLSTIKVHDGADISVKLSIPIRLSSPSKAATKEKLPVLFVTHGGGWIQGTHITEEAWLLWPLYQHFDLCIISVEYRLAPEHQFPTWMDDCWDVLEQVLSSPDEFLSTFIADPTFELDLGKLILTGSSAGGGCAAYLSQTCRDKNIPVHGVVLNVPVLCDYRHLPAECTRPQNSYEQCTHSFLSSGEMRAVWDLVITSTETGADPKASPLLGDLKGLQKHAVFVAGQDPLRDEALAYVKELGSAGVDVTHFTYKGVPHTFAEYWELSATQRFWTDIRGVYQKWLA
ncbi:hypothetical protein H2200_006586 [Cladophialophora chaetospira]|uniref:Alpha/beta hydrolase fold-3 domain-containing protein n=1 Tax=Cladophialophora chaetospira TaxID=386627 RepID=A0AA38X8M0_9EURO|nr:hypothetical protein H2200_006586 [Cladophialophora chaetospira]